ncbi:hypothetical protein TNCV_1898291 [Trichonephila clavipes]|uniref:Uncharacterized protein n=1 Tax=Trichonephila clavipes TaxID=2585209 RepID=A0A8X7BK68_TRICX|nr:hypothetical protein TNCV_1898291 [Trichonephila clavipes]
MGTPIFDTLWLISHWHHDTDNFILQLDGTPLHWSANVRDYFDKHLSFSPMDWTTRGLQHVTYPMATLKS